MVGALSLHQKVKHRIWSQRLWYGEMAFMQRRAPEKHRYWYLILDASCLMTHGSLKVSLLWFLMDCNDHWCFCQRKILELELAHLENRAMLCKCIIHHSSFMCHPFCNLDYCNRKSITDRKFSSDMSRWAYDGSLLDSKRRLPMRKPVWPSCKDVVVGWGVVVVGVCLGGVNLALYQVGPMGTYLFSCVYGV